MGRLYSSHYFYVVVPTCHAETIVSRWGWGYHSDVFTIPHDGKSYYQSVLSSEKHGLTKFVFESLYYWVNCKMMDDVREISDQLNCRVLSVYIAGPECHADLLLPGAGGLSVVIPDETTTLLDVFSKPADQWDEYMTYVVTDAFNNPSFTADARFMQAPSVQ